MTIGFVPTMGALHKGHLSLINKSKSAENLTVCSIFVNPTQFNNPDDFQKYPITIEEDIKLLEMNGCDILFLPSYSEIYPHDFLAKNYELGLIETSLEGAYRPGHFQGVCMVVEILLRIVDCDTLYLGQKDLQQCLIIKKLLELENIHSKLVISETIREENGLAMSSRNKRLTHEEQKKAGVIFQALNYIKQNIQLATIDELKFNATNLLSQNGLEKDYIEITNLNLTPIQNWDGIEKIVALTAVTLNGVRLIDNMILN
jgi:pantoate--beta-alanine ligase